MSVGIVLDEREVHALIVLLDTDRDGRISLSEWTAMFHTSSEDDRAVEMPFGGVMISSSDLPTAEELSDLVPEVADFDEPAADAADGVVPPPDAFRPKPLTLGEGTLPGVGPRSSIRRLQPPSGGTRQSFSEASTRRPAAGFLRAVNSATDLTAAGDRAAAEVADDIGQIDGEGAALDSEPLHGGALAKITVRLEEQPRLTEVWTSRNTMANERISLWAPQRGEMPDAFKPCKIRFCVGHYGHPGSYSRPNVTPLLPEVEDTSVWLMLRGGLIDAVLARFAPHPRQFRRAWQVHLPDPQPSFYAWEPVPPSDSYVAVGMVITTTDEPPQPSSVRCLHKQLCRPAIEPPRFLWNDRGLGGKRGSLWTVNNLHCVWATDGYERPRGSGPDGAFWELREWPFRLDEIIGAADAARAEARAASHSETAASASSGETPPQASQRRWLEQQKGL